MGTGAARGTLHLHRRALPLEHLLLFAFPFPNPSYFPNRVFVIVHVLQDQLSRGHSSPVAHPFPTSPGVCLSPGAGGDTSEFQGWTGEVCAEHRAAAAPHCPALLGLGGAQGWGFLLFYFFPQSQKVPGLLVMLRVFCLTRG